MRERFALWLRVCAAAASLWTGGCMANERPSRLLVDANPVRVEVEGHGTVRSTSVGIECRETGGACRGENFTIASSELVAEPDPGWLFEGWDRPRAPDDTWPGSHAYRAIFERAPQRPLQLPLELDAVNRVSSAR